MTSQEQRWSRWLDWSKASRSSSGSGSGRAGHFDRAGAISHFRDRASDSQAGFVFLQNVEESSLDLRFEMRGKRPHDDRIVIVGIDEKTLQKIGSFPLPRKNYATLVNQIECRRSAGDRVRRHVSGAREQFRTEALQKLRTAIWRDRAPLPC